MRGAITLIGYSPDFLAFPTLPAETNIFLVLAIRDDDDPEPLIIEGKEARISLEVRGPDNSVQTGLQQVVTLGSRRFSQVSANLQMVLPAHLKISQYGEYVAAITFDIDGDKISATRSVHVISGQE